MKRIFYALSAAFLIASPLLGYTFTVTNNTDGQIVAGLRFEDLFGLFCPKPGEHQVQVNPGQSATLGHGACCANLVTIEAISGKAKGQKIERLPRTGDGGSGTACNDFSYTVSNTPEGKLAIK